METKHALASKTVWMQIAVVLSLLLPVVRDWLASNPVEFVAALGAVNVLVRFVTQGKISVFAAGNAAEKETEGGSSGGLPLLCIVGTAAGLCFTALPSCAPGEGMPWRVGIEGPGGSVDYSPERGVSIHVRPTK